MKECLERKSYQKKKSYGWAYKFSIAKKHLFYLFFEKNAISVMFQITDKEMLKLAAAKKHLTF